MLENWKETFNSWGMDREIATEFFKESTSILVAVGFKDLEKIKELSDYLNLPYQIILLNTKSIKTKVLAKLGDFNG